MPAAQTKEVIEAELNARLEDVFEWIDLEKPLGSASISQVPLIGCRKHRSMYRSPSTTGCFWALRMGLQPCHRQYKIKQYAANVMCHRRLAFAASCSINQSIFLMSWGPTGTQQTRDQFGEFMQIRFASYMHHVVYMGLYPHYIPATVMHTA